MDWVNFKGANLQLGKPRDWDDATQGECGTLPVLRDDAGFVSCWRPTPDELAMLNDGGVVTLTVIGEGHPPVSLATAIVEVLQ